MANSRNEYWYSYIKNILNGLKVFDVSLKVVDSPQDKGTFAHAVIGGENFTYNNENTSTGILYFDTYIGYEVKIKKDSSNILLETHNWIDRFEYVINNALTSLGNYTHYVNQIPIYLVQISNVYITDNKQAPDFGENSGMVLFSGEIHFEKFNY